MRVKKVLALILCMFLVVLTSCRTEKQSPPKEPLKEDLGNDEKEATLDKILKSYASDYEEIKENADGTTILEIKAPDFEKIAEILTKSNEKESLNAELLIKTINDHPDYQKIYEFSVSSKDVTEIEKEFLEQVSYELIISAMENIDLNKGEGVE